MDLEARSHGSLSIFTKEMESMEGDGKPKHEETDSRCI
jgi:hypothetical protein